MIRFFNLLAVVFSLILVSCSAANPKTLKRHMLIEEGVQNPTTIEEYKAAIKKFERRAADISAAQSQIAIWHKILGSRYLDKQMYGEALKEYQAALEYYPANQNLFYYVGVCAGYVAKSALDFDADGKNGKQTEYLLLAESAYKRALEIEPHYFRALYGLGVLYVFEMDRPDDAIPVLETACDVEKRNTDAMMLLARAYYATGRFDEAVAVYDRISATTKSAQRRQEAENNKNIVINAMQ